MILHCDLVDLEDSEQIFLNTLWLTIPSLVVKGYAVQRISSRQTFIDILRFCCDLDFEHSNQISSKDTLAYDNVLS